MSIKRLGTSNLEYLLTKIKNWINSSYQTKSIGDAGNYYTMDTVEGALQEIGEKISETPSSTTDHRELTNRDAADQHPMSAITGLMDAILTAAGIITSFYSPYKTYNKGDLVIVDFVLYRAKQAIATPEEWTPAHWEQTSVESALLELKEKISEIPSGTSDHRELTNRDAADQHPMSAITGLSAELSELSELLDRLSTKISITFGEEFDGQTYTITGGDSETYTGTVPASRVVVQNIRSVNATYIITSSASGSTYQKAADIGNYYGVYAVNMTPFRSYISTTSDPRATITATDGVLTYTGTADAQGACTLTVNAIGTYQVTASFGSSYVTDPQTVEVTAEGETHTCTFESLKPEIVSWSSGTDAQIAAMVSAMDAGVITVAETGWSVGNERTVSLSAMSASYVSESHAAQNATFVLMDSGHYDLVSGGKDHFVVGMKDCLNEKGNMNRTSTNSGSWDGSARRSWCNNVFRNAIPATLRNCFKQFKVITAESSRGSTTKVSNDYFALFAEKEASTGTLSTAAERSALWRVQWYNTDANRDKYIGTTRTDWWNRSPQSGNDTSFVSQGRWGQGGSTASSRYGISPFGCI